ncbi:hypothetical protein FF1_028766 [Malus domestica]
MVPTTVVNHGMVQPLPNLAQTSLDGQFRYPGPFFSSGASSAPMNMPGFTRLNSSRPILNNPSHLSTSPFDPAYLPSSFGLQPSLVCPRQNPPTTQFLPHTYMAPQPASVQTNVSAPLTFMGNRPLPAESSTGWSNWSTSSTTRCCVHATTFKYINGEYARVVGTNRVQGPLSNIP